MASNVASVWPRYAIAPSPRRLRWSSVFSTASSSSGSHAQASDEPTLRPSYHQETGPSVGMVATTWTPPPPLFERALPTTSQPFETRTPIAVTFEPSTVPTLVPFVGDNDSDLITPVATTTMDPVTLMPRAGSDTKTPERETSTTGVTTNTHDSYARLLVSLIVLGLVVIAMISIVGVTMEIRRRKQRNNHGRRPDDEYYYDEDEDPLDGYDDPDSWGVESDRTARAYL